MRLRAAHRLALPMSPTIRSALAAGAAATALGLGLGACGSDSDGTIPPDQADALLAALTQVQESVEARDCTAAQTDARQFVEQVNALPREVGEETKNTLREAGNNLVAQTQDPAKCEEPDDGQTTTTEPGATGESGFQDGG
jgi:hypothetical protein